MKRRWLAAVIVLLMLLCGCQSKTETTYTVGDIRVDTGAQTVTRDGVTYPYTLVGDSVTVYCGERRFTLRKTDGGWVGAGSLTDSADDVLLARELCGAVLEPIVENRSGKKLAGRLMALVLVAVSVLFIRKPELAWMMKYGFLFKNAEPSDFILGYFRVGGILGLVFSGILFLTA